MQTGEDLEKLPIPEAHKSKRLQVTDTWFSPELWFGDENMNT